MSEGRVRPARRGEGHQLGRLQAQTILASLEQAAGHPLSAQATAQLHPDSLGRAWERAISATPQAGEVLVAVDGTDQVVGFASFSAPYPIPEQYLRQTALLTHPAEAEINALEVPQNFGRQGHGSRLLAAATDLLLQRGAKRIQIWLITKDEGRVRFFSSAGFVPAGVRRTLDVVGVDVEEQLWYTDLR